MPFCSKPLGAALSIAVMTAMTMASPGRAQQAPGDGQQTGTEVNPSEGGPGGQAPVRPAPTYRGPPDRSAAVRRSARPGPAAVTATVNLRSGPGTDQEIITTIPAGSTVRVTSCSGEWCEVTWNGRSGFAIARNLSIGAPRQAQVYGPRPGGYVDGYGPEPPAVYEAPGYYAPPAVVYGPAYYGPGFYYGPGWGWRRRWGW